MIYVRRNQRHHFLTNYNLYMTLQRYCNSLLWTPQITFSCPISDVFFHNWRFAVIAVFLCQISAQLPKLAEGVVLFRSITGICGVHGRGRGSSTCRSFRCTATCCRSFLGSGFLWWSLLEAQVYRRQLNESALHGLNAMNYRMHFIAMITTCYSYFLKSWWITCRPPQVKTILI